MHSVLGPEQASLVERAIANRREIERLLAIWEEESTLEILQRNRQPTEGSEDKFNR